MSDPAKSRSRFGFSFTRVFVLNSWKLGLDRPGEEIHRSALDRYVRLAKAVSDGNNLHFRAVLTNVFMLMCRFARV